MFAGETEAKPAKLSARFGAFSRGIIVYMRQVIHLPEPTTEPGVEQCKTAMADVLRPFRGRYVARNDGQDSRRRRCAA
jgi:hypothetical protein